jgi:hypothetical protein
MPEKLERRINNQAVIGDTVNNASPTQTAGADKKD